MGLARCSFICALTLNRHVDKLTRFTTSLIYLPYGICLLRTSTGTNTRAHTHANTNTSTRTSTGTHDTLPLPPESEYSPIFNPRMPAFRGCATLHVVCDGLDLLCTTRALSACSHLTSKLYVPVLDSTCPLYSVCCMNRHLPTYLSSAYPPLSTVTNRSKFSALALAGYISDLRERQGKMLARKIGSGVSTKPGGRHVEI